MMITASTTAIGTWPWQTPSSGEGLSRRDLINSLKEFNTKATSSRRSLSSLAYLEQSKLWQGAEVNNLIIKIAVGDEIFQALDLRYQIFNLELNQGLSRNKTLGLDIDEFDSLCDHLIIKDKSSDEIIGTYRLLNGAHRPSAGFNFETSFTFLHHDVDHNRIIELDRACISPAYRKNPTAIFTLFSGIYQYAMLHEASYLMGSVTLYDSTFEEADATFNRLLPHTHCAEAFRVEPIIEDGPIHCSHKRNLNKKIPSLLSVYLKIGAKVMGKPSYDPTFRCFDIPVLFDLNNVSPWGKKIIKRYGSMCG
jgi:putative hemolysin